MQRENQGVRPLRMILPYSSKETQIILGNVLNFWISGLQCNLDKTSVNPIQSNFDIEDKLCPELAFSWENNFTLLGFQIDNRLEKLDVNYKKCYQKIHENTSRRWARYR